MNENPIASIVNAMQTEGARFNPPSLCVGKVIQPEPLQIQVGDLMLDREDLLVSDILLNSYSRNIQLATKGTSSISGTLSSSTESASGGSGDSSFASHSHGINASATLDGTVNLEVEGAITFKTYLKKDDLIALMPTEDSQIYVALCKVV